MRDQPIVVQHVFGRFQHGGAELRTLSQIRALDRARWRFDVVALSGRPGDLDDEVRALGGQVHYLRLGPLFPARFVRLLRRTRTGIVHSHVHYSSGPVLALASLAGVGTRVAHFRSTRDGRPDTVRRRVQRRTFKHLIDRFATHVLAVSEAVMVAAWGPEWTADERCHIAYNGLDLDSFTAGRDRAGVRKELGLPADATLCCHVGRFREAKNHRRLIDLMAAVLRRRPECRLLLIGEEDATIAPATRRRAAELGIEEALVWAGHRRDVPRLLLASDVLVYPSVREGLPGAVLEACAAGLPVVGSDLAGIREIARHFPRVATLSLDDDDDTWARATCRTIDQNAARLVGAWDPKAAFAATPFHVESAVARLEAIYSTARPSR